MSLGASHPNDSNPVQDSTRRVSSPPAEDPSAEADTPNEKGLAFAPAEAGRNSAAISARNVVVAGVVSLGFKTTVLPAASAGPNFHTAIIIG